MDLRFSPRVGDEKGFWRGLTLTDEVGRKKRFYMVMKFEEGKRFGVIHPAVLNPLTGAWEYHEAVWAGWLTSEGPPSRAFAVAAGLCDEDGNTDLPVPDWTKEQHALDSTG